MHLELKNYYLRKMIMFNRKKRVNEYANISPPAVRGNSRFGYPSGNPAKNASSPYPLRHQGLYHRPDQNQFRQHPKDYLES